MAPIEEVGAPLVRLRGLTKHYGALTAVAPLDLDIATGDFLAILGPSGCGKTTLLRMIGGFVAPSAGTIAIEGVDVTGLGPDRRPTNMVFQRYGLFPHMSVRSNVAYGLRVARRPADEIAARVLAALALVRLESLADRAIDNLSGGQQQRVALARALVMRPKVLLLDEPLAALDLKLRQAMQEELARIHQEIGGTFVFVTHDQGEALGLATRIAVMESGRLVQEGSAEDIYAHPNSRFVSTFIGEANLLEGHREDGRVHLEAGASFADAGGDGPITLSIRPEDIQLGPRAAPCDVRLTGRIASSVFLGPYIKYKVSVGQDVELLVHSADRSVRHACQLHQTVEVGWRQDDQRLVDA